ncbi:MAG: carboxypeptidase-like regulatory domain-containing protein [Saprospirales bacterium]|nr:carboxypeptidase-like regulatory domain-containing protein [Saprospirales bacterium]MBK6901703.1 carboxypeptidase-like regulatory domain-containing protein [Saprospirales bacterium]MBK7335410.1 carboxypeptidase-like regulatory domain-containing protein [Saprospirales bacterium]
MNWKNLLPVLGLLLGGNTVSLLAQPIQEDLIQFSGMVLDGSDELLVPIPYTNILVVGEGRGTYSDFNGFFSIVVRKGDLVEFSAIGFKSYELTIPDTLKENRYSLVQLLTRDTINLPMAVIFPWPSRENFRLEFLAMDVSSELQARAARNLTADNLERVRATLPYDGRENADYYLRQQASSYYYIGQTPPMNIFNPIAWKDFFEAWKRGDFKKK